MEFENIKNLIPKDWQEILKEEFEKEYFAELAKKVLLDYEEKEIFPPKEEIFNALNFTKFDKVKIVIIGQDPYHDYNQAHGLSFSVPKNQQKIPPSLKNIYKELKSDLNIPIAKNGNLIKWAEQGILLLNATLTVEAHKANSHQKYGWDIFTDKIIEKISEEKENVVFVLWGNFAQKKECLIDENKHKIISDIHPSPLSASRGFFGSKPFSKINNYLESKNKEIIDWDLNTIIQPELF